MDIKMQEAMNTKRMHESHLQDLFNEVDEYGSGTITFQELERLLGDPHFMVYLDTIERKGSDAKELFQMLDYDGSGQITKEEFCTGFLRLKGEAKSFNIHRLVMQQNGESMQGLSRSCNRTYNAVLDITASLADLHKGLYEGIPERRSESVMNRMHQPRRGFWLPDDPAGWANRRPTDSAPGAAASRTSSAPPAPRPVARVLELVAAPAVRVGADSSRLPWPPKKQVLRNNAQTVELHEIFEI